MLRHVVIWSMKEEHTGELSRLLDAMDGLADQIDEVAALSTGRLLNESRHHAVLVVDLADDGALDRYRAHPEHQPVLEELRALADEIVVADYTF